MEQNVEELETEKAEHDAAIAEVKTELFASRELTAKVRQHLG
jgi:uncharacterized coiled-coil protein SlyX